MCVPGDLNSFPVVQIELGMVGMDLKIVVQGRELVSMQLLDTHMSLVLTPDPPPPVPDVSSLVLALRIVDISIRDLQVQSFIPPLPPHSPIFSKHFPLPCLIWPHASTI